MTPWKPLSLVAVTALWLASCGPSAATPLATAAEMPTAALAIPESASSTNTPAADRLADVSATLQSLTLLDEYPLYTMRYVGEYPQPGDSSQDAGVSPPQWGCSLFAAFADPQNRLYGRNFDWEYSPALLLFTDPPDGYASVSMVDITFLGYSGSRAKTLADAPLAERMDLLAAPLLPFDGMNEKGLAIGMAAVSPGNMPVDPAKPTIGSLGVIRQILDHAATVDEAVDILGRYNVDMTGGPPIHYLIADVAGNAALVEFSRGEMIVTRNQEPWHLATNFIRAEAGADPKGACWRYDRLSLSLAETAGKLTPQEGLSLLKDVSQDGTQWSVVYGMSTGEIHVVIGQRYDTPHILKLEIGGK